MRFRPFFYRVKAGSILNDMTGNQGKEGRKGEPGVFQLRPLLFLTGIFFLTFISRIILAPLLPTLENEMGISHSEAGSLFLFISLGYFVTLTLAGFISSSLTHRKTIILSSVVVGAALLGCSFSHSLWGLRLGTLLLGMATGIYLPSGIATLTSITHPRHWGKAIAIHELGPNLSFMGAPLIAEALMVWVPWRGVLMFLGCVSVLMAGAFKRVVRGGEFRGEAPNLGTFKSILSKKSTWIMMILFSLGIASTMGIFTMLPLYLVIERGIEPNRANTLIGLSRISALGMAFVAGWFSDRLGARRTLGYVILLSGIATLLLGIVPDLWIIGIIFLQPMLAVSFFPAGFSVLSMMGPPQSRATLVSLSMPFAVVIGGGVIPMGIGFMGDRAAFALGIVMAGGLMLLGLLLLRFLEFPEGKETVA